MEMHVRKAGATIVAALCLCLLVGVSAGAYQVQPAYAGDLAVGAGTTQTQAGATINAATRVALNAQTSGRLNNASDEEWYSVNLSAPGKFELVFGGAYATRGSWKIYLYNAANKEIWSDTYSLKSTVDSVICTTGLPAGTFYIRVDNYSSAAGYDYHFTPRYAQSGAWEAEFNDTIVTANTKPLGATLNGNLQTSNDEDWFRIVVPSAGKAVLTFGGEYATRGSWRVYLYTEANKVIWESTYALTNTKDKTICTTGLPAGTFYVRVDNYSSAAGYSYHFKAEVTPDAAWENELNDTIVTANPKSLDSTVHGNLQVSTDEDWYSVTLAQAQTLKVMFGGDYAKTGSWKVYLYDSSNKEVWSSTHSASNTEDKDVGSKSLSAGTYYIRVDNYSGVAGLNYHFRPIMVVSLANATVTGLSSEVYTGRAHTPAPVVKVGSTVLKKGVDYTVRYASNVDVGTATVYITGMVKYANTRTATFRITPADIARATVSELGTFSYRGSALTPEPKLTYNGMTLAKGQDYTLTYSSNKNTGTASVAVLGMGNFTGSLKVPFTVAAGKNTITAKNAKKKLKADPWTGTLASQKSMKISARSKWATSKLKFKKANKAGGGFIKVSKKGKLVVKSGLPVGTYKVKVKITSAKSKNYKSASKKITVTVKVS